MPSKQQRYNDLRAEDREDDRSSTEVESLMEEVEKPWNSSRQRSERPTRTQRTCALFNQWRWLIDTTLLVAILVFVIRLQSPAAVKSQYQLNGDITGVGPKFTERVVKWEPDEEYAPYNISEFFEPQVLDKWNKLMPLGMGFQWVKDPENPKYSHLPTPIEWDQGKTVFTTSWTHQLHCLWAVVQTYAGLKTNTTLPEDHHWHMIHCFSYMRQAILCSADTAIEGHETTFPDDNGGSDGWDAHHVCKDMSEVRGYLEGVRAYSDQEIF
ncbi:uncharacterized protein PG998_006002 [Apiospora kogelbergensis]|uniref:Oxidase ustYa n=1 Tax=Apiospora kogelbergensis TaxID=1337665 RepID=A0AAW0R3Z2_9PEZI